MGHSEQQEFDSSLFPLLVSHYRKLRNMSVTELARKSKLSKSYLSDLLNGKKGHTRPSYSTIHAIATALDTTPEALHSMPESEEGKFDVFDSPVMKNFLPSLFRLSPDALAKEFMVKEEGIGQLLMQSFERIIRKYRSSEAETPLVLLRTLEASYDNYFPKVEGISQEERAKLIQQNGWEEDHLFTAVDLEKILTEYGYSVRYDQLPGFENVRWIFDDKHGKRIYWLNPVLDAKQRLYNLAAELGHFILEHKHRTRKMSIPKSRRDVISFRRVLEDRRADYFAEAFLLPRERLIENLTAVFQKDKWDPDAFMACAGPLRPDAFSMRILSTLKSHFGLEHYSYFRYYDLADNEFERPDALRLRPTKSINHTKLPTPQEAFQREHLCHRFNSVRLLKEFRLRQSEKEDHNIAPMARVQVSHTLGRRYRLNGDKVIPAYLVFSIAYPLNLLRRTNAAVTVAIQINPDAEGKKNVYEKIKFLRHLQEDETHEEIYLSISCERCPIPKAPSDEGEMGELGCQNRRAPNTKYRQWLNEESQNQREDDILRQFALGK